MKGVKKELVTAYIIMKPSDIDKILSKETPVSAADDNGAFNIWYKDNGELWGESFRWLVTQELRQFENIEAAKKWAAKWFRKIK